MKRFHVHVAVADLDSSIRTLSEIPVFGEDARSSLSRIPVRSAACCVPKLDG